MQEGCEGGLEDGEEEEGEGGVMALTLYFPPPSPDKERDLLCTNES